MAPKFFWGIDCGSTEIKVVCLDLAGQIVEKRKTRTLFPLQEHLRKACGRGPFDENGALRPDHFLVGTGYGRNHMEFVQERMTEIKAHHLGVQKTLGQAGDYTVIDIGGQDAKVITVKDGEVANFVINRKCAAGTGAYIEELAHRLNLKLEDLTSIEAKHDKELFLNSFCTVFAGQEVIKVLMEGEKVENLIHALYQSVVKRVCEMTPIGTAKVVFSGGVLEHHPAVRRMFQEKFADKVFVLSEQAQFCGALGAAEYGRRLTNAQTGVTPG